MSAPPAGTATRGSGWDAALLAALILAYLALFMQGVLHTDFSRDLTIALQLLAGDAFPLEGPILAGQLRLGPAWYWLLAALLAIGQSLSGVLLGLGLIGALQFPLAYACGRALHSPLAGRLWAVLLLPPAWSSFEAVFPQHTSLTASAMLGFGLCALRYVHDRRRRYLPLAALAAALALHAHPTALGLIIPALGLVALAWRRRQLDPLTIAACGFAVLLPFAPMLIAQWRAGWPLLATVAGHYAGADGAVTLATAPALLWQAIAGGGAYLLVDWLGYPTWSGQILQFGLALLLVAAAIGTALGIKQPVTRVPALTLLITSGCVVLTVLLLRAHYPYYMTTVIRVALFGLVALGLAVPMHATRRRGTALVASLLLGSLLLHGVMVHGVHALQRRDTLPLAVFPLFHVTGSATPTIELPLLGITGLDAAARWGCARPSLALHGSWIVSTRNNYGVEFRMHCPQTDAVAGGADPQREHWLGLTASLAQAVARPAEAQAGALRLYRVRQVLAGQATPLLPAGTPAYPPLPVLAMPEVTQRFAVPRDAGTHLVATAAGFVLNPPGAFRLLCNGQPLTPAASDARSTLWRLDDCASGTALELDVRSGEPHHIDIALF